MSKLGEAGRLVFDFCCGVFNLLNSPAAFLEALYCRREALTSTHLNPIFFSLILDGVCHGVQPGFMNWSAFSQPGTRAEPTG
jgi:hypothetical protein